MVTAPRWAFGSFLVAAVVVPALLLGGPASARQDNRDQDRDKDTQSRHEMERLRHIPLVLRGGRREDINMLVLVQTRILIIEPDDFGIRAENLDKIDVGEVPVLGSLFGDSLRGEDLSADNRVGAVYSTGTGGLAAFLDDAVAVGESEVSVVNGKFRYTIAGASTNGAETTPELGELGKLSSVQQAIGGTAAPETTLVLRGLTRSSVPAVDGKAPVLGDIPVLQSLFRGTAHQRDHELIFFIRPSIIAGDEE